MYPSIDVTPSGSTAFVRLEQPWNADKPIVVTPSGISISVRLVQCAKAAPSIILRFAGSFTLSSLLSFINAQSPSFVTVSASSTVSRLLHLRNAESPTIVTPLSTTTVFILDAYSPNIRLPYSFPSLPLAMAPLPRTTRFPSASSVHFTLSPFMPQFPAATIPSGYSERVSPQTVQVYVLTPVSGSTTSSPQSWFATLTRGSIPSYVPVYGSLPDTSQKYTPGTVGNSSDHSAPALSTHWFAVLSNSFSINLIFRLAGSRVSAPSFAIGSRTVPECTT